MIAARQRQLLLVHLEQGTGHDDAWLAEVEKATVEALAERGSATAAQLSTDEPRLRTQLLVAEGKKYERQANITTRVLTILSAQGRIVRGRPRGSWISSQYAWWPIEAWVPGGLPEIDPAAARAELARRWLAAYGPATVADLTWWSGWTKGRSTRPCAEIDTGPRIWTAPRGWCSADDVDPEPPVEPWVALLPALDTTIMGWQQRHWYLGQSRTGAVRHEWQRRADGLVRRTGRRRVGAAVGRSHRLASARGHRHGGTRCRGRRGGTASSRGSVRSASSPGSVPQLQAELLPVAGTCPVWTRSWAAPTSRACRRPPFRHPSPPSSRCHLLAVALRCREASEPCSGSGGRPIGHRDQSSDRVPPPR